MEGESPVGILSVVCDSSSRDTIHTVDAPLLGWPKKFRRQWLRNTRAGAQEVEGLYKGSLIGTDPRFKNIKNWMKDDASIQSSNGS